MNIETRSVSSSDSLIYSKNTDRTEKLGSEILINQGEREEAFSDTNVLKTTRTNPVVAFFSTISKSIFQRLTNAADFFMKIPTMIFPGLKKNPDEIEIRNQVREAIVNMENNTPYEASVSDNFINLLTKTSGPGTVKQVNLTEKAIFSAIKDLSAKGKEEKLQVVKKCSQFLLGLWAKANQMKDELETQYSHLLDLNLQECNRISELEHQPEKNADDQTEMGEIKNNIEKVTKEINDVADRLNNYDVLQKEIINLASHLRRNNMTKGKIFPQNGKNKVEVRSLDSKKLFS